MFPDYCHRLKRLPKELHPVELVGLEPLSDEFLFSLNHGPDLNSVAFPPGEGFFEVINLH